MRSITRCGGCVFEESLNAPSKGALDVYQGIPMDSPLYRAAPAFGLRVPTGPMPNGELVIQLNP